MFTAILAALAGCGEKGDSIQAPSAHRAGLAPSPANDHPTPNPRTNAFDSNAFPASLTHAVRRYNAEPPADRFDAAMELMKALPSCPSHSKPGPVAGAFVTYDYSHPSYRLGSNQVIELLGPPVFTVDLAGWPTFFYPAGKDRPNRSWVLSIEFCRDYAVGAEIMAERLVTNRPEIKWSR
jgi:hypothetical protein